jgi:uncharacterized membrane protein YccC
VAKDNPSSAQHAARTAIAAIVSVLVARLFRLPESYWAAISTLIVMQSTVGAALPISVQRFAGTAVGAALGAVAGTYFPGNIFVFGLCVLLLGLLSTAFRVERAAYRYAGIALTIVMLVASPLGKTVVALHRFSEVSIGIVVGLVVSALWPERSSAKT